MTAAPSKTFFSAGQTRSEAEVRDSFFGPLLDAMSEMPGGAATSELTISAGTVTPTNSVHTVDTELDAAADYLTHIATDNHPEGRWLVLSAADAGRVTTAKHGSGGAGQVLLADSADLALSDTGMRLVLLRTGDHWTELGRWWGGAKTALKTWLGLGAADTVEFAQVARNALIIRTKTADGADTSSVIFTGGGAVGTDRGADIQLGGNEEATLAGDARYRAGNVAGAGHKFYTASGVLRFEIGHDGAVHLTAGVETTPVALTDSATVTPDLTSGTVFTWAMGNAARTLGSATLIGAGTWEIYATANAGGSTTLSLHSDYTLVGGEFDGSAGAVNLITLKSDGTTRRVWITKV